MKEVQATREGLVGRRTASGYIIDTVVPFVSLPSVKALERFVRITNPANGLQTIAVVLDVGPHNEHDDDYVFGDAPPEAASGQMDELGRRPTNSAGIDLSEKVWRALKMRDNTQVQWEFIT